jgi:UDP-N-acetylmuramoylalanine--D-glutamate ligase
MLMAASPIDIRERIRADWTGRRVTLMGLGRHGGGVGAAKYLAAAGARLTISELAGADELAESLAALRGLPIHAVHCGGHDPRDFVETDCVVVNPAVRPDHPLLPLARASGARITSEIELFLDVCPARVIGVTGSNGKSTTATMLHEILSAAGLRTWLGGNIGTSLLDRAETMSADDWVVLELSSFQLAHLSDAAPAVEIAVVTNCTPNHLDWHANFSDYEAAKRRLLRAAGTLAILNPHDPISSGWKQQTAAKCRPSWPLAAIGNLAVDGDHNRQNAALAAAAAEAAGVSESIIRGALSSFRGLRHRLQGVGDVAGRRFYNDSKATSPAASAAAAAALDGPLWLVAGGVSKNAPLEEWAARVVERTSGAAVFGAAGKALAESLCAMRADFNVMRFNALAEAVAWCWRQSKVGDAILLSPACASFDQFSDFEARGDAFCAWVGALAAREEATARRETQSQHLASSRAPR